MRRPIGARVIAAWIAAAALLAGCGSSDDPPPDEVAGAAVFGTVRRANNDRGIEGVKVWLLEEDGISYAAGPAITDVAGDYRIAGVSPGRYFVVAGASPESCLFAFSGHDTPVEVAADSAGGVQARRADRGSALALRGDGAIASALGGVAYAASDVRRDLVLEHRISFCGDWPRVIISVVDEATGAPVAHARIAQFVLSAPLDPAAETFTGSDGQAAIDAFPSRIVGSDREILEFLLVSHPEYAPRQRGAPGDTIFLPPAGGPTPVVRIELARPDTSGGGSIRGRILLGGSPLAGVRVGLRMCNTPGGCPIPAAKDPEDLTGAAATPNTMSVFTDPAGRYAFRGLEAGEYFVRPAYSPVDGYVSRGVPDEGPIDLSPGESAVIGDVPVAAAMVVVEPADGTTAPGDSATFRWGAVPGVFQYVLELAGVSDIGIGGGVYEYSTMDTTATVRNPQTPGSIYRWRVKARSSENNVLSRSERPRVLTFGVPEAPAAIERLH